MIQDYNGWIWPNDTDSFMTMTEYERRAALENNLGINQPDEIELQLLLVVMDDSHVVIKAEHCSAGGEWVRTPTGDQVIRKGQVQFYICSFSDIRAAIDALEQKPPVPRIEWDGARHTLVYDNPALTTVESRIGLANGGYDALSQLAGKPLPIWTPTKGEWKQVVRQQLSDGNPTGAGCDVWRYTRRKVNG